jgi:hypothetical protein
MHDTQQTQHTNIYALSGIRTYGSSIQAGSDLRLGPYGPRDRQSFNWIFNDIYE